MLLFKTILIVTLTILLVFGLCMLFKLLRIKGFFKKIFKSYRGWNKRASARKGT